MTFVIIIQMNSVTNQTCQLYRVAKISDIDASIIFHFQKEIYERHQNIKEFYPIAVKIKKNITLTEQDKDILYKNLGTRDATSFGYLLSQIIENAISDYNDIVLDETIFTGAFFFARDMSSNDNDLNVMKHYLNHIDKEHYFQFALYKFDFEINDASNPLLFNLSKQMDNVLRSSALTSIDNINFSNSSQIYVMEQLHANNNINLVNINKIITLDNLW